MLVNSHSCSAVWLAASGAVGCASHRLQVDGFEFIRRQVAGLQRFYQMARPHDPDARTHFPRPENIVRGHQYGRSALGQAGQNVRKLVASLGVWAAGGFVEQQRLRLLSQRNGNAHFLPHSLRVRTHPVTMSPGLQSGAAQ